jgi:antitoxin component of MazEF toxin-antitoxin module
LKELGFEIGEYVSVVCENGRLVITLDIERAAMEDAEAVFMEREMVSLKKKFEVEKSKLHAHFVAEKEAGYGVGEK